MRDKCISRFIRKLYVYDEELVNLLDDLTGVIYDV
jgi:hypothetical protein